jgi:osmotically-inducible protein OsmY
MRRHYSTSLRRNDQRFTQYSREGASTVNENYVGKGPKGYKRSDERIREEVCEVLARHPRIDATEIEVDVNDGEVTLTGTVIEKSMKRMAADIVDDVPGVRDVFNHIHVLVTSESADFKNKNLSKSSGKAEISDEEG